MSLLVTTRLLFCTVVSIVCGTTFAFSVRHHERRRGMDNSIIAGRCEVKSQSFAIRMVLEDEEDFSADDTINTGLGDPNSSVQSILGATKIRKPSNLSVSFSHLQLFVDKLGSLDTYKQFEDILNQYDAAATKSSPLSSMEELRQLWESFSDEEMPNKAFVPQNRDVVKQLMAGVGFRVTGCRFPSKENTANTRSLLLTSRDPSGVQILISAIAADAERHDEDEFLHFDAGKLL
jgi:hypothetical protein